MQNKFLCLDCCKYMNENDTPRVRVDFRPDIEKNIA